LSVENLSSELLPAGLPSHILATADLVLMESLSRVIVCFKRGDPVTPAVLRSTLWSA